VSFKLQVSFAKEPYKRDYSLQKRPIILRSLVIVATPQTEEVRFLFLFGFGGGEGTGTPFWDCARGCSNRGQSRPIAANNERNRYDSEDIRWAFVFGSRIAHNCALSQLSLCTHNPDRSLYNCFSISVQFFPRMAPHFFDHHDSPSNLAKSRYPRGGVNVNIDTETPNFP